MAHSPALSSGLARLSRSLGASVIDNPRARSRQRAGTATLRDLHNGTAAVACTTCGAERLYGCTTRAGKPAARPHAARLAAAGLTA